MRPPPPRRSMCPFFSSPLSKTSRSGATPRPSSRSGIARGTGSCCIRDISTGSTSWRDPWGPRFEPSCCPSSAPTPARRRLEEALPRREFLDGSEVVIDGRPNCLRVSLESSHEKGGEMTSPPISLRIALLDLPSPSDADVGGTRRQVRHQSRPLGRQDRPIRRTGGKPTDPTSSLSSRWLSGYQHAYEVRVPELLGAPSRATVWRPRPSTLVGGPAPFQQAGKRHAYTPPHGRLPPSRTAVGAPRVSHPMTTVLRAPT